MAVRIPAFQQSRAIVDDQGLPTTEFLRALNNAFKVLVDAQNATQAAIDAAAAANAAAATANTAATTAQAAADASAGETSIVNSFPTGFTGASPVSIDSAGMVTVKNHNRQYGDTTLNPTVAVTGATFATSAAVGNTVRVFYDDPTRAGGAVTYQFTIDPAAAPVQGGDRHVVGAATVPGAGSVDGGFVRPPGYTGSTP